MFHDPDAQSPWNRLPSYGFRTVTNLTAPSASALAPINYSSRDYAQEKPASNEEFHAYRRFYVYDRTSLEARVDSVDETSSFWRMEKVSFNAAYGQERITAYLLLPTNVDPPYQTVVYFPGSGVLRERSADVRLKLELSPDQPLGQGPAFLARSGRAVLYPSTNPRGSAATAFCPIARI